MQWYHMALCGLNDFNTCILYIHLMIPILSCACIFRLMLSHWQKSFTSRIPFQNANASGLMIVGRSMEHGIFTHRGAPDSKKPTLGYYSPVEERMEGVLWFQGKQIWWFATTVAHDSRRKGRRKRVKIRRPDSCHLDSLFKRLPHIFRCKW